jgi:hypothetical protein
MEQNVACAYIITSRKLPIEISVPQPLAVQAPHHRRPQRGIPTDSPPHAPQQRHKLIAPKGLQEERVL